MITRPQTGALYALQLDQHAPLSPQTRRALLRRLLIAPDGEHGYMVTDAGLAAMSESAYLESIVADNERAVARRKVGAR